MKFRTLSFMRKRNIELLPVALLMICFIACISLYFFTQKNSYYEDTYSSMKKDTLYVENYIDDLYTQLIKTAQNVGYTTAIQKMLFSDYPSEKVKNISTSRELLANTKDQSKYITDLFYYSDGGHLYSISEYYSAFHNNMEQYGFDKTIRLDHEFMSDNILKDKDATFFFVYTPIYRTASGIAHRNKTNGICAILVNFSDVCPACEELLGNEYATFLMYDGEIISANGSKENLTTEELNKISKQNGKVKLNGKKYIVYSEKREQWTVLCVADNSFRFMKNFYKDTTFYIYLIIAALVFIGALYYSAKQDAKQREIEVSRELLKSTIAQQEAKMSAYRSQINPHFFFNTLECVRSMAQYYHADMVEDIVTAMSKMFRYSLYSSLTVSLSDEVDMLEQYFVITSYRFPDRYELNKEMEEEALKFRVPSMILQPLVENAIKHAFKDSNRKEKNRITVKCSITENELLDIRIVDNGIGMSQEKLDEIVRQNMSGDNSLTAKKDSIGIQNIYERIKLFDERNSMEFSSKEGEYTEIKLLLYPASK